MERECLAAVWAITDQFHCYLYGAILIVRTDNRPLSWLRSLPKPTPRIARWILKLQEYDFEIIHRPGSTNRNADALSRLPLNAVFFQSDKSVAELREQQLADQDLRIIIKMLEGNAHQAPDDLQFRQRSLLSRLNEFQLHDSVLLRVRNPQGKDLIQVVVPHAMKQEILRAFHDDPPGGHLSRDKMLGKIRPRYYWPNLIADVKRHCRPCLDARS